MQTGLIYFLTPRKCSVVRVHCEAIPRQIKFPTDEEGKGANAMISRLYYFFDVHCLGETDVFPHADNCTEKQCECDDELPDVESDDRTTY